MLIAIFSIKHQVSELRKQYFWEFKQFSLDTAIAVSYHS